MGVESFIGVYIDGLNVAWPIGASDFKSEGDDHLRGVKLVLQNSFPNVTGAVTASHTELNYLDIAVLGTGEASKAITVTAGGAVTMAGLTWTNLGSVTTCDINGGSIDGSVIGANSAAAITGTTIDGSIGSVTPAAIIGTTLKGDTSLEIATGAIVTGIADEDDMSSDSATLIATQQSIKAYADSVLVGLGTSSGSAVSSFDLTWTNAGYTKVVVVGSNFSRDSGTPLLDLRGADSGVFKTGASDYGWKNDAAGLNASDDRFQDLLALTSTTEDAGFTMHIYNPGDTGNATVADGTSVASLGLAVVPNSVIFYINFQWTGDVNGIRIFADSGTFSGTMTAYGYK